MRSPNRKRTNRKTPTSPARKLGFRAILNISRFGSSSWNEYESNLAWRIPTKTLIVACVMEAMGLRSGYLQCQRNLQNSKRKRESGVGKENEIKQKGYGREGKGEEKWRERERERRIPR